MAGMLFTHIFDTKIINNQTKGDGSGFMYEEARSIGASCVTPGSKMFVKAFIGNNARLG
jgi:hypothetical protein